MGSLETETAQAEDLTDLVLTCQEDINNPNINSYLESLTNHLQQLVSNTHVVTVKKVEPWNSIRVTLNISREAAAHLRTLAEQGDQSLVDLGILSVQVDGDRIVLLSATGDGQEPTELIFTTNQTTPRETLDDNGRLQNGHLTTNPEPDGITSSKLPPDHLEREINEYMSLQARNGVNLFELQRQINVSRWEEAMQGQLKSPEQLQVPREGGMYDHLTHLFPQGHPLSEYQPRTSDGYSVDERVNSLEQWHMQNRKYSAVQPFVNVWQFDTTRRLSGSSLPVHNDQWSVPYKKLSGSKNVDCTVQNYDMPPQKKRKRVRKPKAAALNASDSRITECESSDIPSSLLFGNTGTDHSQAASAHESETTNKMSPVNPVGKIRFTREQIVNPVTGLLEPNNSWSVDKGGDEWSAFEEEGGEEMGRTSCPGNSDDPFSLARVSRSQSQSISPLRRTLVANHCGPVSSAVVSKSRLSPTVCFSALPVSCVPQLTASHLESLTSHVSQVTPNTLSSSLALMPSSCTQSGNKQPARKRAKKSSTTVLTDSIVTAPAELQFLGGMPSIASHHATGVSVQSTCPAFSSSKKAVEHALELLFDDDEDEQLMKLDFDRMLAEKKTISAQAHLTGLGTPCKRDKRSKSERTKDCTRHGTVDGSDGKSIDQQATAQPVNGIATKLPDDGTNRSCSKKQGHLTNRPPYNLPWQATMGDDYKTADPYAAIGARHLSPFALSPRFNEHKPTLDYRRLMEDMNSANVHELLESDFQTTQRSYANILSSAIKVKHHGGNSSGRATTTIPSPQDSGNGLSVRSSSFDHRRRSSDCISPMGDGFDSGEMPTDLEDIHSSDLLSFDSVDPSFMLNRPLLQSSRRQSDASRLVSPSHSQSSSKRARGAKALAGGGPGRGRRSSLKAEQTIVVQPGELALNVRHDAARASQTSGAVSMPLKPQRNLLDSIEITTSISSSLSTQTSSHQSVPQNAVENSVSSALVVDSGADRSHVTVADGVSSFPPSVSPRDTYVWMGSEPDLCGSGADSGIASNTSLSVGSDLSEGERVSSADNNVTSALTPPRDCDTRVSSAQNVFDTAAGYNCENGSELSGTAISVTSRETFLSESTLIKPADRWKERCSIGSRDLSDQQSFKSSTTMISAREESHGVSVTEGECSKFSNDNSCQKTAADWRGSGACRLEQNSLMCNTGRADGHYFTTLSSAEMNSKCFSPTVSGITSIKTDDAALQKASTRKRKEVSNNARQQFIRRSHQAQAVSTGYYQQSTTFMPTLPNFCRPQTSVSVNHLKMSPAAVPLLPRGGRSQVMSSLHSHRPPITSPMLPQQLSESVQRAMLGALNDSASDDPDSPELKSSTVIRITKTQSGECRSRRKNQWCVQSVVRLDDSPERHGSAAHDADEDQHRLVGQRNNLVGDEKSSEICDAVEIFNSSKGSSFSHCNVSKSVGMKPITETLHNNAAVANSFLALDSKTGIEVGVNNLLQPTAQSDGNDISGRTLFTGNDASHAVSDSVSNSKLSGSLRRTVHSPTSRLKIHRTTGVVGKANKQRPLLNVRNQHLQTTTTASTTVDGTVKDALILSSVEQHTSSFATQLLSTVSVETNRQLDAISIVSSTLSKPDTSQSTDCSTNSNTTIDDQQKQLLTSESDSISILPLPELCDTRLNNNLESGFNSVDVAVSLEKSVAAESCVTSVMDTVRDKVDVFLNFNKDECVGEKNCKSVNSLMNSSDHVLGCLSGETSNFQSEVVCAKHVAVEETCSGTIKKMSGEESKSDVSDNHQGLVSETQPAA